jgi:arabinose-5-phosphate isomerase
MMGVGKSRHISSKIAATFASTGTPSFFVYPAETGHGDFGMITKQDAIIVISNSGNTKELFNLVPRVKELDIPLITITSNPNSYLAKYANIVLNINVIKEACPLNLAPTSSSTTALVLGDALALSLLEIKKFSERDFAKLHPHGSLGKKLFTKVKNIMHKDSEIPIVHSKTSLTKTIVAMNSKGLGVCLISNDKVTLNGVFTDGDLRRVISKALYRKNIEIQNLMTLSPRTVHQDELICNVRNIMNYHKINTLPVINSYYRIVGVITMHTLNKVIG